MKYRKPLRQMLLLCALPLTWAVSPAVASADGKVLTPWGEVERTDRSLSAGAPPSADDGPKSQSMNMDYRDVILYALQKNLDIEIQRYAPKIRETQIQYEKGAFDPVLGLGAQKQVSERPLNRRDFLATGQIVEVFNEENISAQSSLSGRIRTGLAYEVLVQASETKNSVNIDPLSHFFPEYTSSAVFRVSQPLLKNFGDRSNLAGQRVAESQLKTETYRLYGAINQITAEALSAYIDVIFAQERIVVNKETIQLAEKLREENQRRLEQGKMSPIDIIQAESAIAQAETELIRSQSFLVERSNVLKNLVFRNFNKVDNLKINPTAKLKSDLPILQRGLLIGQAMEGNPDYQAALQVAETEDIRLKFAQVDRWPQLDLEMSMGWNGLEGDWDESFENFDERREPDWSVGLVFNMPIGNRQGVARLSEAQYRAHQALLTIKQVENSIGSALSTAMNRVQASHDRVASSLKNVEFAQAALDAEQKRLDNGLTTSFNVLQLQDDLSRARILNLETLVEFNKALIVLYAVVGDLPNQYQIQVRTPEYTEPQMEEK